MTTVFETWGEKSVPSRMPVQSCRHLKWKLPGGTCVAAWHGRALSLTHGSWARGVLCSLAAEEDVCSNLLHPKQHLKLEASPAATRQLELAEALAEAQRLHFVLMCLRQCQPMPVFPTQAQCTHTCSVSSNAAFLCHFARSKKWKLWEMQGSDWSLTSRLGRASSDGLSCVLRGCS